MPSARGIQGSITQALRGESTSAGIASGDIIGKGIVSRIKAAIITAGIGTTFASSLKEGAAMEQAIGGIETLFKDSADKMTANAQNAFRTAGLSANAYMETVTSFSASLLQSLDGDTQAAAAAADLAVIDMSDNANKLGTSMELIQNAYQGFAKQNYTMLDNLKLGYGGTKEEMERLIADANKVKLANGEMADLSISSFADVTEAVHIVQTELGITGTTAKEAAETFSGSFNSMKGALKTFLGNLSLGKDVKPSLDNLRDTIYIFLVKNAAPMVFNIVKSLATAIATTDWASVAKQTISRLRADIESAAMDKLKTDGSIVDAIVSAIKTNLPKIGTAAGQLIGKILSTILTNLPTILSYGVKIVANLATGLINSLPAVGRAALNIASEIWNAIRDINWIQLGIDLVAGFARGILDGIGSVISAAKSVASSALEAVKDTLEIRSPSARAEKEAGYMVDEGLAKGIRGRVKVVTSSMNDLGDALMATKLNAFSAPRDDSADVARNIVTAIITAGDKQAEALEKGLGNMRLMANNREIARMLTELGFTRG